MLDTVSLEIEFEPPDGAPLKEVWVFVARDKNGYENVIATKMKDLGWQPLITGNPETFQAYLALAKKLKPAIATSGITFHLLKFTQREEVEF